MNKIIKEIIDNKWKEDTKLSTGEKIMLILYAVMFVFSITVAILEKNAPYIIIAILWLDLFICEFSNKKNSKMDQALIGSYEELKETQDKFIKLLLEELRKEARTVCLKDIKIPKNFKKPGEKKLNERFKYYEENKNFKVPIILNESNTLVDGYTSYLIAKKYKLEKVKVQGRK